MNIERILEIIKNREYSQILKKQGILNIGAQYNIMTNNGGIIRIVPLFKFIGGFKRVFMIYLFVPSESKPVKLFRIERDDKYYVSVRNAYKTIVQDYNGELQLQIEEKYMHFF